MIEALLARERCFFCRKFLFTLERISRVAKILCGSVLA
jgi:hypothetical protein